MNYILSISLCFVLAGGQLNARNLGEHLEPVHGYFFALDYSHSYYSAVRSIFFENSLNARAFMLTLPAFDPESAVFITIRDEEAAVVSSSSPESIWYSQNREAITVNRRERPIRTDLARKIVSVFDTALGGAKYPPPSSMHVTDGVRFYFSAYGKRGLLNGQIHSPNPDTLCGELVALGALLHKFAREDVDEEVLVKTCGDLANRISTTANQTSEPTAPSGRGSP